MLRRGDEGASEEISNELVVTGGDTASESILGGRISRHLSQTLDLASGIEPQATRYLERATCIALTPPRKMRSS
jgi:hypothetical protein